MWHRKSLTGLAALVFLGTISAKSALAAPFYTWDGRPFSTVAPVPQSTGLGTYFNFFNNENVDTYGLPANLVFGAWFSTYVSQGAFYGPNGSKVAGAPNGGNLWANVAYINWIYPFQFDTPSFRVAFNAFMPIIAATTSVAGPTQFWFTPLEMFYSYHQFRYLRDSTFFGPYFSLPVGGGFGFTPANGQVNQYNFAWLSEGWYQFQHMDELAVGPLGLWWLNGIEYQPWFSYNHQLNSTPNLPNTAVFGAGGVTQLGLTPGTVGGYMPGDNIALGNMFDYPLKNIFPDTWLTHWRVGFLVDGTWSVFQNTYTGHPITNSAVEMIAIGPSIQYQKGDFVIWFYDAQNVKTQNYYSVNQFFIQFYYFFNL
jgi:hypothetical protein